jgi:FO synthase
VASSINRVLRRAGRGQRISNPDALLLADCCEALFTLGDKPDALFGGSRKGPTFREAVLMHAVPRLVLNRDIPNIQASWVKMGVDGVGVCLDAGVNDLGGTLMNESISRAAGAAHGQELTPAAMSQLIRSKGRTPWQRTTLYKDAPSQGSLLETVNL